MQSVGLRQAPWQARVVQVAGEEVAVTRRAARHGACAVRCRRGASGVRVTGVCGRA